MKPKENQIAQSNSFYPVNAAVQKQLEDWFDSLLNNEAMAPFVIDDEKTAIKNWMLSNVLSRIDESIIENKISNVRQLRWSWLKMTASVILFSCASWFGYKYWVKSEIKPIEYVAISANTGKVVEVVLPDSTTIWLQAGSTLKYPKQFSDTSREVFLDEGLAFFKVTHNEAKPFIVHTPQLDTRVLGTSFVVRTYKQLEEVQVELLSGRVRVSHNTQALGELTPNKRLTYNKSSAKVDIDDLNTQESALFVRGDIVLKRAGFDELFTTLQNIYGVKFKYDKELLKGCQFNLRFNTNLKIEQVMEIINGFHPIKYKINGKEIIIQTKGCNQ